MTDDAWKDRLQARMHELKHTMKSLSLAAGLGETGIRDMLKRTQSPSMDAIVKVAKALGISLSELCEGPTSNELRAIAVVGETGTAGSNWFELPEKQIVVLNNLDHRVDVQVPSNLLAIYDHSHILIFERIPVRILDIGQSGKFLLMTKAGLRYFGPITRTGKSEQLVLSQPAGGLVLEVREIEWIAQCKQTLLRSRH